MNSIGAVQSITDRERAAIAVSYRAVSFMDVYWVRAKGDKGTFDEICLYNHSLSDAFVDVSLRGRNLTVENAALIDPKDQAGDIATPGVAPKAWVRHDGRFYLLKDGEERDVEAELLASKVVGCFRVNAVKYEESEFDGTPVSRCEIITSKEKSIVSAEFVEIYCANRNKDFHEFVLKTDSYSYYMMNIIDYLIGNVDRHWGNWGFLVDNKTNRIEKIHPLMDYNKSFLSYETLDGAVCQTTKVKMSQKEAAVEAVRRIGLNQIREIDRNWFEDKKHKKMFLERLAVLQELI